MALLEVSRYHDQLKVLKFLVLERYVVSAGLRHGTTAAAIFPVYV